MKKKPIKKKRKYTKRKLAPSYKDHPLLLSSLHSADTLESILKAIKLNLQSLLRN